ncbi:MAG: DUF4430 domain-containing protein [Candidatus Diapherotrites archaeon]
MRFGFICVLLFVVFFVFGCVGQSSKQNYLEQKPVFFVLKYGYGSDYNYLFLKSFSGQKVFDALVSNNVNFTYKDFGFGKMVLSVENLVPQKGEYLAIYVDGVYADKGISELEVKENAVLEFRIEKVN